MNLCSPWFLFISFDKPSLHNLYPCRTFLTMYSCLWIQKQYFSFYMPLNSSFHRTACLFNIYSPDIPVLFQHSFLPETITQFPTYTQTIVYGLSHNLALFSSVKLKSPRPVTQCLNNLKQENYWHQHKYECLEIHKIIGTNTNVNA